MTLHVTYLKRLHMFCKGGGADGGWMCGDGMGGGGGGADWGGWDAPHWQDLKTCTKSEHVLSSDLFDLVMIRSNTNRSMCPLSYFLSCLILPLSVYFLICSVMHYFRYCFLPCFLSFRPSFPVAFLFLSFCLKDECNQLYQPKK